MATFKRPRIMILFAVSLIALSGPACLIFGPKRPLTWHITLEVESIAPDRETTARQTIEVIRKRLDASGVYNFDVRSEGDPTSERILVSLPEVADRERLKRVITAGGKLELTHVVSPPSPSPCQTYASKEEAIAALNNGSSVWPEHTRVLPYTERAELGGVRGTKWVVVEAPAIINDRDLRTASAIPGRGGAGDDYEIQFALNKAGAEKFGAWTGANINEYLGVVLNDEVKSIAYIKSQIFDQGEITGHFTQQSAEDLALILRSGGLPAPVKILEEGPNN